MNIEYSFYQCVTETGYLNNTSRLILGAYYTLWDGFLLKPQFTVPEIESLFCEPAQELTRQ